MRVFRRDKSQKPAPLTLEETIAVDLGKEIETLSQQEIEDFSDRVFEWIPILLRQASRDTGPGFDRLVAKVKFWGKKLLLRRGAASILPGSDTTFEIFEESFRALLLAFEKHSPVFQRIFVEQAKRYQAQQEAMGRARLESAHGTVIEIEAVPSELRQLGPIDE